MRSVAIYTPGRTAAAAMAEHGLDEAIKLASNEVPYGPLPGVSDAAAAALGETYRYADHDSDELAAAFADIIGVSRANVAVGPGSVGLLQQLTLAYAGPGDEVLYPWPSFIAYPQFSGVVAAEQVTVPLKRFSIDIDAVLAAVTPRTRVIFIANPNNPASGAVRRDDLERLIAEAPADCLVVVDEAYREFVTGADVPDALEYVAAHPNVVVLRTLSKAYGMAGMRVGFLIADPTIVNAVYATMIPFAVNGPAQAAALVALQQRAEVERRCALVVEERERGAQILRRAGLGVPASQANFWWLPTGAYGNEIAVELERRGVVVRPFPTGIRVTAGRPEENKRFLDALASTRSDRPDLFDGWQLATGERAQLGAEFLGRLEAVLDRIRLHATTVHDGLTRPVPGEAEQWEAAQVWAHMAEFGDYWLRQLGALLDTAPTSGPDSPVPFGRTRHDRGRIDAIEHGRATSTADHLDTIERAADRLATLVAELTDDEWRRVGLHSTLGEMDVARQLDEFHVGHYEQHADQLDELTGSHTGSQTGS